MQGQARPRKSRLCLESPGTARQGKVSLCKAMLVQAWPGKAIQPVTAWQGKDSQGKEIPGKSRLGKAMQVMAKQNKARPGMSRQSQAK